MAISDLEGRLFAAMPRPEWDRLSKHVIGLKRRAIEALRANRAERFLHDVALALGDYLRHCKLRPVFESNGEYFLSYCPDYNWLGELRRTPHSLRQRMHPVVDMRYENRFDDLMFDWDARFSVGEYLFDSEILLPESGVYRKNTKHERDQHSHPALVSVYLAPNYQKLLGLMDEVTL
jgi:hypothetical protein